jgi:hypothetical protein
MIASACDYITKNKLQGKTKQLIKSANPTKQLGNHQKIPGICAAGVLRESQCLVQINTSAIVRQTHKKTFPWK